MNSFNILLKTPRAINCTMILLLFFTMGCKDVEEDKVVVTEEIKEEPAPDFYFGIDRNNYAVKEFKIKRGDTFGKILESNGIDYPEVYAVLQAIKGTVNIRKLTLGKPYTFVF